jgi:hypothetical protein
MFPKAVYLDDPRYPLFNELALRAPEPGAEGEVGLVLASGRCRRVRIDGDVLRHADRAIGTPLRLLASVLARVDAPGPIWVEADRGEASGGFGLLCEPGASRSLRIRRVARGAGGIPSVAAPGWIERSPRTAATQAHWAAVADLKTPDGPEVRRRAAAWIAATMAVCLPEPSAGEDEVAAAMAERAWDFAYLVAALSADANATKSAAG